MKNKRELSKFLEGKQKINYPTKEMFLGWLVEFEELKDAVLVSNSAEVKK